MPHFRNRHADEPVVVKLDGAIGYAASFLEEAFGGLAREVGTDVCELRVKIVSKNPELVAEVLGYMRDADDEDTS